MTILTDPSTWGSRWRDRAACLTQDPELFFPIGTAGPAADQIEQAKAVCRACPVQGTCLQWALATDQRDGVWGGLSEDELRAMKRLQTRRARQKCEAGEVIEAGGAEGEVAA